MERSGFFLLIFSWIWVKGREKTVGFVEKGVSEIGTESKVFILGIKIFSYSQYC